MDYSTLVCDHWRHDPWVDNAHQGKQGPPYQLAVLHADPNGDPFRSLRIPYCYT